MTTKTTEEIIAQAMARAAFVSAWADNQEERGKSFRRQHLEEIAPKKTPKAATQWAWKLIGRIEQANGKGLCALLFAAEKADGIWGADLVRQIETVASDEYARQFGHYLAMQALGHGVSWFDDHAQFPITIPHAEFYL